MSDINNIYRKKNLNENSKGGDIAMGAGQGAISGASAGAAFGPWGIGIGAALGGIGGGLQANNTYNAEQEQLAAQQSMMSNPMVGYGDNQAIQFAMGGPMQGGPSETSQLNEFNGGGTHEQNPLGGIPVGNGQSVESGETELTSENYVFSDRILINEQLAKEYHIPNKFVGKSFAEYSKKINKNYSHREDDKMDEESKKRELDRLMDAQESFKNVEMNQQPQPQMDPAAMQQMMQPQGGLPGQMAMGGYRNQDSYKKAYGDPPPGYNNRFGTATQSVSDANGNFPVGHPGYVDPNAFTLGEDVGAWGTNTSGNNDFTIGEDAGAWKQTTAGTPTDMPLLKGAEMIGAFAPLAYNLFQGIKPEEKLNKKDYHISPNSIEAANLNINPILRSNTETLQTQHNAIRSASGGSGGTYLANMGQAQLNKQKGDADAYINKDNYDDRSKFQADQMNISTDLNAQSTNRQSDYRVDHDNMKSAAVRRSHLGAAALQGQGIANLYAQNRFDKGTADELTKAGITDATTIQFLQDNPEALKAFILSKKV